MILHAVFFAPGWLSTATLIEMTLFRMNYAGITLRQFLKTWITVTLVKALIGLPATMNTENIAAVLQFDFLFDEWI